MVLYVVFFYSYTIDNRFHWLFRTSSLNGDYCTVLAVFRPADSHVPLVTCSRSAMLLCSKAFVWCGEQCFFFFTCWQSALCQSTQLWISPRWRLADLVWSWERMLCPSLTVACQHLSHTILYKCRALSLPTTFPPRCLLQLPLDSIFFFLFPTAQNVARSTSQQDRKSLSRLVASAFLAPWCTVNAGKKWQ